MNDLERMISQMSEDCQRAARLGYALGYVHGDTGRSEQLPVDHPSWRVLEELGYWKPGAHW